jgi:MYXO-CTERM domain-containing protein
MQLSTRIASVALALAAVASQSQAATFALGTIDATGKTFGNSFSSDTSSFTDYYTFTIAAAGDVTGTTTDTNYSIFVSKDVVLSSLTLTTASSSTPLFVDTTANSFTFTGLTAGDYKLAVKGSVSTPFLGIAPSGSYSGTIKAVASSVASPAPEPADLALTLVGLAGVGMLARRRTAR